MRAAGFTSIEEAARGVGKQPLLTSILDAVDDLVEERSTLQTLVLQDSILGAAYLCNSCRLANHQHGAPDASAFDALRCQMASHDAMLAELEALRKQLLSGACQHDQQQDAAGSSLAIQAHTLNSQCIHRASRLRHLLMQGAEAVESAALELVPMTCQEGAAKQQVLELQLAVSQEAGVLLMATCNLQCISAKHIWKVSVCRRPTRPAGSCLPHQPEAHLRRARGAHGQHAAAGTNSAGRCRPGAAAGVQGRQEPARPLCRWPANLQGPP